MGYGPPYGPPPSSPPPSGYGYGGGQSPASQGNAIAALVANVVALCPCLVTALIGVALASIALTQHRTNPNGARILTSLAWVSFGLSILVGLFLFFSGFYGGFVEGLMEGFMEGYYSEVS